MISFIILSGVLSKMTVIPSDQWQVIAISVLKKFFDTKPLVE